VQPLRLLHVISSVAPGFGGPSKAVQAMTRALADRGHQVTIATTDAADDANGRLDVPLDEAVVQGGVAYRYFARRPGGAWKFSWALTRWLSRETASFDVAHVHGMFQHSTMAGCRISRRNGVPYVLRPLGTLDAWSLGQHAWKKLPYLALVERSHIRHAAALHATSGAEAGHLRALGVRRIAVIPLGVDFPSRMVDRRQASAAGGPALRVLFLSRLHPKKGIPILLEAIRMVREAGTPVVLTVAGSGDPGYEAQVRAMAAAIGVADVITWTGHVDGARKAELFADADLFVLPSSQENFGIAVAEALAWGVPALVSHEVAIAGDIAAAGAGKALPIDAASFAEAITHYARHPETRLAAGDAAAAFARESYSWQSCAERLEGLYRTLTGRDSSPHATAGSLPTAVLT
jgi:glycosyltransferase involved in cell wall biosynthesis